MKSYKVAIIGAGSAGLSARKEVARVTDSYVVIDDGPLGTTCARVGCMPSKVLIQSANDFHRRQEFAHLGIKGQEALKVDQAQVLKHVRELRDRFVNSVIGSFESWQEKHLIRKRARFIDPNTLDLGDEKIHADAVIVATGSSPIVPRDWEPYRDYFLSPDDLFDLETFPARMAVVGLGVIGLELGQALNRLGVDVVGIGLGKGFGGLTDEKVQDQVLDLLENEMPLALEGAEIDGVGEKGLMVRSGERSWEVDKLLLSLGRRPNLKGLGLEEIGVKMDERSMPEFDANTLQLPGHKIFIAGDVNGERSLLHEASDDGRIAGFNGVAETIQCFRRRTPLAITFSDPNIAMVGASHRLLVEGGVEFEVGEVSYQGQGRAIVKLKEKGLLRIYGEKHSGKLLGAELLAPGGEHLAHLLAWAISLGLTVRQTLSLPFYHPVLEEGVRTALRHLAEKVNEDLPSVEVLRCQDAPVGS